VNNPESNCPDAERIGREAAGWLVKRDRGLTAAEQDEFFQWLAADPGHGEWLARHQRTWKDFNLLAQWRPEHSSEPNPDLLARPRRATPWLAWTGMLAAAGVAAALYLRPDGKPPVAAVPAAPAVEVARAYERRVLEDGSVIELNDGARVEVAYTPGERRVRLVQGEASFTVAKNPRRPFIVRARGVDVRAVGTIFNVRLEARSVEVLVTEGKVGVDDAVRGGSLLVASVPGESPLLLAGQQVVLESGPITPVPAMAISPEETALRLAWRPHLLDFNSMPLGEVVAEFNRCNRIQLVLADPALAALPIVASFRSDNVEGFVRLLEQTTGVQSEHRGDGEIILRRAR
jgi:transmembrane sensor